MYMHYAEFMKVFLEILKLLYIMPLKTAFLMDFQARSGLVLVCFSYVCRSTCALTCSEIGSFVVYSSSESFLGKITQIAHS